MPCVDFFNYQKNHRPTTVKEMTLSNRNFGFF